MANPIRYAILDHAADEAALWELPWSLSQFVDGRAVEIHPARSVDEVRPHLIELLREGHLEMYRLDEPDHPRLTLDEALTAAGNDSNWDPPAQTSYAVMTTQSGDREYEIERRANEQRR